MDISVDAVAFRGRLDQRLEARAGGDERALALDRERVLVDRLLARLVAVAPDEWAVTGPFALDLRYLHCSSVIRKLEIEWRTDCHSGFMQAPEEMVSHDLGDHFEFRLEQSGMGLMGEEIFSSFDAHAFLAGKFFATVSIVFHLRYGKINTESLPTYDLLEFAGLGSVEVPVILFEIRVAEMLHDYINSENSELGISRAEALIDLREVASRTHFRAFTLREAIPRVFKLHETPTVPESLPRPVADGAVSEEDAEMFRGIAERAGAPTDLNETYDEVAALVDPILSGEVETGTWDVDRKRWVSAQMEGEHDPPAPAE